MTSSCESCSQFDSLLPLLLLPSLTFAAQKLIFEWASNPRNLVLFTSRAAEGSLARKTLEAVSAAAASRTAPKSIPVQVAARRSLTKKEIDARDAAKAKSEVKEPAAQAEGSASADVGAGAAAATAAATAAAPAAATAAATAAAPATAGRGKKRSLAETASVDAVVVKAEPMTKRARSVAAAAAQPGSALKTTSSAKTKTTSTVTTVAKKKRKKVLMFADNEPATREWDAFGLILTQADFPWLVTGIAGVEDAAARLAPFDLARLNAARTEAERAELLEDAAMSAAGVAIEDTKLEVKTTQLDIRCKGKLLCQCTALASLGRAIPQLTI